MVDGRIAATLTRLGLGEPSAIRTVSPLTGGVSSDVFRVDLPAGPLCVKYAVARLRVATEWTAPLRRSAAEFEWLTFAGAAVPGSAPRVFGYDPVEHGLVMELLAPAAYPVWKAQLLAGIVDVEAAAIAGARLAAIHARSAAQADVAARFDNAEDFRALRTDPYLRATALRHPDLAPRLHALADELDAARIALVHGDVSPKNLLSGPDGPVFIDAECATFGDPAFDIAFFLNHLVIKALVLPAHRLALRRAAAEAWRSYRVGIAWEDPAALERRVAALLPALMLARVDGKSPLEYLDRDAAAQVRARGRAALAGEPPLEALLGGDLLDRAA